MTPVTRSGVAYALAAFLAWGANPLYFKAVGAIPIAEVLAHRVVWAVVLLALWISLRGRWGLVREALADRRTCRVLLLTTVILSVNWLIYIWAIDADRVLETSLGYYINPLVNVVLGMAVLRERLSPLQLGAVALAAVGVVNLAVAVGGIPWVSLSLAGSFGVYGLLRKTAAVDSPTGLFIETGMLLPVAAAYVAWVAVAGGGSFGTVGPGTDLLLVLAGPVTALPLIWFTHAARRLRYATVGLFQYIAPTGHFLLAVLVFGEAFTIAHAVTFACIWTALALFTADTLRTARRTAPA
jgi:chloramphenicol-sensitive protein RarD